MPYAIKKVENGYKVKNTKTGKYYSKYPLTLETASKQLRVLEMVKAGGLASDILNVFTNSYSRATEKMVKKYGDAEVTRFLITRIPIQKGVKIALDLLSVGKFTKQAEAFDDVYHLFAIIEMVFNGNVIYFETEKVPEITWKQVKNYTQDRNGEEIDYILPKSVFFKDMIKRSKQTLGGNFHKYTAVKYNCQNYIYTLVYISIYTFVYTFVYKLFKSSLFSTNDTLISYRYLFTSLLSLINV